MLIEYINKAMSKAIYEKLEDGTYSGKIPQTPGVIAFSETLYKCQEELKSTLEGWLIVKIRHGDKLPVLFLTMQNILFHRLKLLSRKLGLE